MKDASNNIVGQYKYDGDGKRIKKIVPSTGETTIFVYDASGKMVAEYSTQLNPTPQVSYLTTDLLVSPRINTDQNGNVIARHDYHPFGEEIERTSYGADDVRKQFTAYEKDEETDLDFAQARYFNSGIGRFSSPDPYNIIFEAKDAEDEKKGEGQKLFNGYISQPQNWNRYVYVWNNPLRNTDPDGEKVYVVMYTTENGRGDEEFRRAAETRAAEIKADGKFDPKKDTVLLMGVKSKKDVQNVLDVANSMGSGEKGQVNWGKVQQVQIFSHGGPDDGPILHNAETGNEEQFMSANEIQGLKVNWESGAEAYFMGCNTAKFAQNFANGQKVDAWGHDRFTNFSSSPDSRRSFDSTGPLYLIGVDGFSNGLKSGIKNITGYGAFYPMVRKKHNR